MKLPDHPQQAGPWTKEQRYARDMSANDLAKIISRIARAQGDPTVLSQQVVSKFEQGQGKKMPAWTRFIVAALEGRTESYAAVAGVSDSVSIKKLPGSEGDVPHRGGCDLISFSRDLIERELCAASYDLRVMVIEGNSMEPDFRGGDQVIIDIRRKSLAQPGAFCIKEDDGYVVRYLERIPDNTPAVRVVPKNPLYDPQVRMLDEVDVVGRVVWTGRKVS